MMSARGLCIVSGGTGVIGLDIVKRLAESGRHVAVMSRSEEALKRVADIPSAHGLVVDWAEAKSVDEAVRAAAAIAKDNGLPGVRGVVCCAGATSNQLLLRTTDAALEEMMAANFMPTMRLVRASLRYTDMLKAGDASVVALSSVVAGKGNVGQVAYGASKAAVEGAFRSMSREYGPKGVRFNVVAPGLTESDMAGTISAEARAGWAAKADLRRLALADEVAAATVSVLDTPFMTGQTITVCGGL